LRHDGWRLGHDHLGFILNPRRPRVAHQVRLQELRRRLVAALELLIGHDGAVLAAQLAIRDDSH
jgi:hypothetical protein